MKNKIRLSIDETLVEQNHRIKGSLSETDIWAYSVVNSLGEKTGTVVHEDHTSINGFRRTQSVEQRDASGKIVVSETWNGD